MVLVLTADEVASLIDRRQVLAAVERAHADLTNGLVVMPVPQTIQLGDVAVLPMIAAMLSSKTAVVKLLVDMVKDGQRFQQSTIVVCSTETGACEAIVDGHIVTAVRTAAASAVATMHLARPGSSVLGLIGAGNLAYEHLLAIREVMDVEEVLVWSRSEATTQRLIDRAAHLETPIRVLAHPELVTRRSDVLCTLTPSRDPLVAGAWFSPGLHVNAVGAPPRLDHREIDSEGMRRARVVVDSLPTSLAKSGDAALAIADGAITEEDVSVELGDVIVGKARGRETDDDITLFNSVGLALQDAAAVRTLIGRGSLAAETGRTSAAGSSSGAEAAGASGRAD